MTHLGWGLQITVLGMGLVLGVLALLWGLLVLVLRFDRPPAAGPADAGSGAGAGLEAGDMPRSAASVEAARPRGPAAAGGPEPAVLAVIGLAIALHRAQARTDAAPAARAHWPGSLLHASRWVAAGRARQHRSWRRGA